MFRQGGAIVGAVLVGVVAAGLSVGRVLIQAPQSLSELVWAEDGLFALCVRKAGLLECLADPFAGYLLGLPRLLAGVTALTPIEQWGWVTNAIAAVSWGALSGLSTFWLLTAGVRWLPAVVVALAPVVIPLVGLEAVNSIGSVYMPLLFTTTLVLAVGWQGRGKTIVAAVLVFLTAVTIPTAALLIAVIALSWLRGRVERGSAITVSLALIIGSALQFLVVFTAPSERNMAVGAEAVGFWLNDLPTAVLTLWPGLWFGTTTIFGIFTIPVVSWTGLALAIALVVLGVRWASSGRIAVSVAGIMLVTGVAYSFIPTATGYASNRYFVLTVLGVVAAAVLLLDDAYSDRRRWLLPAIVVIFAVAWAAAFPASAWRATAAPPWSTVLEQVRTQCSADPTAPARFVFSPDWPQEGITQLQPPTNEFASCTSVGMALDR